MSFANKITIFRILSVPFFIATLVYYSPQRDYLRFAAIGIFLLAIISDIVDGYIARTLRQKTKAGAILDPLADKLLLIVAFICLYFLSHKYFEVKLPLFVLLIVASRDMILIIGGAILLLTNQNHEIEPTWWGKISTFLQMMIILLLLLKIGLAVWVWRLTVVFTLVSGMDYLRKGIVMFGGQVSNTQIPKNNNQINSK